MTSKNENNFDIKITDFGFARFFKTDEQMSLSLGSPFYKAPELY